MASDTGSACEEPACFGSGGVGVFEATIDGGVGGVIDSACACEAAEASASWVCSVSEDVACISAVPAVMTVVSVGGVTNGASVAWAKVSTGSSAVVVAAGAICGGPVELAAVKASWSLEILTQSLSISSCSWVDGFFFCIIKN